MKKLILFAISTIFFYSCNPDEFLDVVPTGSKIPNTIEDFDKLLENPEPTYIGWANIVHMDPDILLTDELYNGLLNDFQRNQYRWSSELYLQNETDNSWKYRYKNIYVYNLIIQDINDADLSERTEEDRKVIKGQAYAQRAFSYFYLVNEYAPHYSNATLNTPAVPMPLQPDLTAQLPRSTVGEIYAQIEKDLNTAEPLLENFTAIDETNFRPGKASILGLRAWIALYKGDFEAAKTYADEALSLYNFMYDYTQFTLRTPGNTWSGLSTNELYFGTTTQDNVWAKYYNFSYNRPGMLYNPDLIPLYDQDNDYRFVLYANHFTYAGADVSPNFAYSRINSERQVGVTTPDLYMISAEGHARTGNTATAIERLNTLLDNRILNYTPMSSSDFSGDAALLQFIKDERRKEFFATGKTWFDMKRYHAYGESIPTFTRTIDGQTITLEPGSDKYVVPISPKILNQNPNL
ncbi:RagB/SusD family nutrient uptake outer membrane protein [Formosa sp. S-31]|uniref:RagB/SusD family nutrient uptake outer membrane protein n=1 Tax=Formosa sp. S-31 TaxID=2790949 RepID=UPI003EBA8940